MFTMLDYDRAAAVAYARKWAKGRNPRYYDFSDLGGDCTNFASQCVYAGSGIMNFTPVLGWYYLSASERTASWTGVEYFYNFMTANRSLGPYAEETDLAGLMPGDVVQLGRSTGDYYHTPVVTGFSRGVPLLAAHTVDALDRPLTDYIYERVRYLHIVAVRAPGE